MIILFEIVVMSASLLLIMMNEILDKEQIYNYCN